MNVLIVAQMVPHVYDELTDAVKKLEILLKEYGYKADSVVLPGVVNHEGLLEHLLTLRLYDLQLTSDKVICMGGFSHLIRHENKTVWFSEYFNDFYDFWDDENSLKTAALRQYVMRADRQGLLEAKQVFATNSIMKDNMLKYSEIRAESMYLAPINELNYKCLKYGDYVFYNNAICEKNMQLELVNAMKDTKTKVRLIIAGEVLQGEYEKTLLEVIQKNQLQNKVEIISKQIFEKQNSRLMSECLAYVNTAKYGGGFFAQEINAFFCGKPVISCALQSQRDTTLFNKKNSIFCEINQLAKNIDMLFENRAKTQKLGECGKETLKKIGVSNEKLVRELAR